MNFRNLFVYSVAALAFAGVSTAAGETGPKFGDTPLAFEPNRGQWADRASFGTHAQGFSARFHGADVVYTLNAGDKHAQVAARWIGAAKRTLVPVDQLPGTANYYLGKDESRWISGLPTYRRLKAAAIYPGIDLVYYGDHQQLEYDLVVAPGADVSRVVLSFEGGRVSLDAQDNLVVSSDAGLFVQHRPVAFQQTAVGARTPVDAHYVIAKQGQVKLELGTYDPRRELVIDPTIAWSQTLGSGTQGSGQANAIALDSSGNLFIAGNTDASDFPVTGAYQSARGKLSDAFLTRLSTDGSTVLFSTYFGGSDQEAATGLAVDTAGNAIVVGWTFSPDMGTRNAYQTALRGGEDAFVAKFTPAGTLVFATFLGGTLVDQAYGVATDSANSIYVAGTTNSTDFPTLGAYQANWKGGIDGFVTKFAADGSALLFSTYLGGSQNDIPAAIAVGNNGRVYVAGATLSMDFPTLNAFKDTGGGSLAFVTCLAPSGSSAIYSTYLGESWHVSQAQAIDVDATGAAFITGYAAGVFPLKNPAQATSPNPGGGDAFLSKLSPDGTSLVYSTYLAGSSDEQGMAVKVDSNGSAFVAGYTMSNDFPTIAALRPANVSQDAFLTKFSPTGDSILFSTYLGGNRRDTILGLALDSAGNIFVSGSTDSSDFPSISTRSALTPFVVKLSGPVLSIPVTFKTIPSGLQVTVDGQTRTTPVTFQWAPAVSHSVDVPGPQVVPGPSLSKWLSWSNGGAKSQTLTTPSTATTFTASLDNIPCAYSLTTPSSVNYGQAGVVHAAQSLTTQHGCPWAPSSSASWITTTAEASAGPGILYYSVAANIKGGTRTGTLTVGSAVLTIIQSYSVPSVTTAMLCCATSGLSQLFSYDVYDADGTTDLTVSNLLINSALDGRQACYLAFDHGSSVLYLVNDEGTSIAGMPFDSNGRGTGVLSNSQCSVDGTKSAIFQAGTTRTEVTIALSFTPSFGGNKVVYLAARDKEGLNSDWQGLATWGVPAATTFPSVASAALGSPSNNPAIVTATYQDVAANTDLSPSQILINTAVDGRNACYMGYDHKNNILYLVKDDGSGLLPGIAPGTGTATQQNSQCIIYAQGSSVQANGKNYTLNVQVFFLPAFRGPKIIYAATQTLIGGNTGWQAMNAFTVQ